MAVLGENFEHWVKFGCKALEMSSLDIQLQTTQLKQPEGDAKDVGDLLSEQQTKSIEESESVIEPV